MIQQHSLEQLASIRDLLMQLTDELLSRPLEVLQGSTIGMHLRHMLEFYQCLFHSLQGNSLNYDLRARERQLEVSVQSCLHCIEELMARHREYHADRPLQLQADCSQKGLDKPEVFSTTYYRELLYNIEHCVHHLAIIKIGLKSVNDPLVELSGSLGVAASTLRNNKPCAQ